VFLLETNHKIVINDARNLSSIDNESVDLIVTSPPYPMIEMWDDIFISMNSDIRELLENGNDRKAFEYMHIEMDGVWKECFRVLKPGSIICINIGDAVRTFNNVFQMYSNHSKIINSMFNLGFIQLPDILWRKQTNAPNKFMGSGMLPSCAYITYEHEYILIFRKGEKRSFTTNEEKTNRRNSAYFWEERNLWFSDVWSDVKGTTQKLKDKSARERSAAYPFELAYRLILMFSVYGDIILDPFIGTGTTTNAAIFSCRNSIGVDIEKDLENTIDKSILSSISIGRKRISDRIENHKKFIYDRIESGKEIKYNNENHNFGIISPQEKDILLYNIKNVKKIDKLSYKANYEKIPYNSDNILTQLNPFF
jgi:modification methylase